MPKPEWVPTGEGDLDAYDFNEQFQSLLTALPTPQVRRIIEACYREIRRRLILTKRNMKKNQRAKLRMNPKLRPD